MTDRPVGGSAATRRSAWGMVSVLGALVLLFILLWIRGTVTGIQEQELQESRRVIHDIRTELDSLRNERRTVLDSVAELRAVRSSLNAEVVSLNTEVVVLRESRSQYFSDTRQRVVADVVDRIDRELGELETEARRATEYQALLEWLDAGRNLAVQHHVPRVDTAAEAATIVRLKERERPYVDRFRRLVALSDSLRDAGEEGRRSIANTMALSAALDTARVFSDSVMSILNARTERAMSAVNRTRARSDWLGAGPPSWRVWSYGVTFEELAIETGIHEPESLLYRLQVFHEEILERESEPRSALTLFASISDLPPLRRLLPEDRQSLQRRVRLFLEQRGDVIGVPLEVRVEDIDDATTVVLAGTTVLENIAAVRSELDALRRAMLSNPIDPRF